MFGKTRDINDTDTLDSSAIDEFFGDEAAAATTVEIHDLRDRVEQVESQINSQFTSLATYARINDYGFIESPYKKVENGRVLNHFRVVRIGDGPFQLGQIITGDDLEEERRLAYVGLTRAQRTLVMTCAERRRRGGEMARCEPSRFLDELPEEDLEWFGVKASKEKATEAKGKAHLDGLKALLGES
mgnify:CR=1 FL=1